MMRLTRRSMVLTAILLSNVTSVSGCADDAATQDGPITQADAAPADLCEGAELEIGTGARTFEPADDGDTVYLYRGPQGGYMIYLSVRARGIDPEDATVCYTETFLTGPETGVVFGEGCWRVKLTNDVGDGRRERVGLWGEVEPRYWAGLSYLIRGQDARVEVTISDARGCTATDGWETIHIHEDLGR